MSLHWFYLTFLLFVLRFYWKGVWLLLSIIFEASPLFVYTRNHDWNWSCPRSQIRNGPRDIQRVLVIVLDMIDLIWSCSNCSWTTLVANYFTYKINDARNNLSPDFVNSTSVDKFITRLDLVLREIEELFISIMFIWLFNKIFSLCLTFNISG